MLAKPAIETESYVEFQKFRQSIQTDQPNLVTTTKRDEKDEFENYLIRNYKSKLFFQYHTYNFV